MTARSTASMEKFLRAWRQDAVNRGQHDTAVYIGDKILALSNSDADAFWLAQVHFNNGNYTRALSLLSRRDLIDRSLSCRYLAANCFIRQGKYDHALNILGEDDPVHLISTSTHARRKLSHVNGTRHGPKTGRSQKDRVDVSEERDRDREQAKELRFEAGMCYLRGLCYSRRDAFDRARDCYKNAVRIDVQCFEAFEELMGNSMMSPAEEMAFLEELDFEMVRVEDPATVAEAADFTKMLYTTRLSKYTSPQILANATETLSTHYNLASNPDMLLSRAEMLYTQCRFHEALAITTEILNTKPESVSTIFDSADSNTAAALGHNKQLYPLHLGLLYETGSHNTLFHLSHTLSIHAPHEAYTYLAIGTYYFATARIAEARRFFSKASLMDPHSAAAWIGFAHTFAAEGEHDQAIAAYSTGSRLFQGSHLPQLFMGMQHLALNNMQLALQYCKRAFEMSTGTRQPSISSEDIPEDYDLTTRLANTRDIGCDPLVLNEIGVIFYHQNDLPSAAKLFKRALELAASLGCNMTAWVATRANLAHTLRRLHRPDEALAEFDECLRTATGGASPLYAANGGHELATDASAFASLSIADAATSNSGGAASGYDERNLIGSIHTSRGIVLLGMPGRTKEAVMALHEAVRVLGGDAGGGGVAGTLLGRAIEIWALEEENGDAEESDDDLVDDANVNIRSRKGKGPGGGGRPAPEEEGEYDPTHGGILVPSRRKKGKAKKDMTGMMSYEKTIADELDGNADEILDAALASLR